MVDFGFSSDQIFDEKKGFSFMKNGPLDMRYDKKQKITAADIVNNRPESDLIKIFKEYGEEFKAEKIAQEILKERKKEKIKTTFKLVEIIEKVKKRRGKISPATKVFQALRIAVNNELNVIENFLPQAIDLLEKGGRLAVISFHSGEDRIVKHFFKKIAQNIHACRVKEAENPKSFASSSDFNIKKINLINKHVIKPKWTEIKNNPRARSAKLRIVEKI